MERQKTPIMRGAYVLDACVIIKWFCNEELTEVAIRFRDELINGNIEIIVPDLLLYELSNALRYNPNFDEKDVKDAIESIFSSEIRILVPTSQVLKRSVEYAYKFDISLYDSYYVAMAKELDVIFITSDARLYNQIRTLNFVKSLEEFKDMMS